LGNGRPRLEPGRIGGQYLAGDQPVEQHPYGGQLLLDAPRRVFLLQALYVGRHVERPDRG
jgi:hypothetical protein